MSNAAAISTPARSEHINSRSLFSSTWFTALAGMLSTYFVIAAWSLYWLTAGAGAVLCKVIPRSLIERAPLAFLGASSVPDGSGDADHPRFLPRLQ